MYEKHYEDSMFIPAPAQDVFDYIDDHSRFYSHVIKFSRMAGGHMDLEFDAGHGQVVGSDIRLFGKIFGKSLSLEEVIIKREPPNSKTWESVGIPNFFIVGQYRMNIQVASESNGCRLKFSIDYDPPPKSGWLRRQLNGMYAKLCAKEMVKVTRSYFIKHRQINVK